MWNADTDFPAVLCDYDVSVLKLKPQRLKYLSHNLYPYLTIGYLATPEPFRDGERFDGIVVGLQNRSSGSQTWVSFLRQDLTLMCYEWSAAFGIQFTPLSAFSQVLFSVVRALSLLPVCFDQKRSDGINTWQNSATRTIKQQEHWGKRCVPEILWSGETREGILLAYAKLFLLQKLVFSKCYFSVQTLFFVPCRITKKSTGSSHFVMFTFFVLSKRKNF